IAGLGDVAIAARRARCADTGAGARGADELARGTVRPLTRRVAGLRRRTVALLGARLTNTADSCPDAERRALGVVVEQAIGAARLWRRPIALPDPRCARTRADTRAADKGTDRPAIH